MESVRDCVEGIRLGLAAGDRNGGPIRVAVHLAESLADSGTVDVGDIAARYMEWWHHGAFDTGPVAARVFTLVGSAYTFDTALDASLRFAGAATADSNRRMVASSRSPARSVASEAPRA